LDEVIKRLLATSQFIEKVRVNIDRRVLGSGSGMPGGLQLTRGSKIAKQQFSATAAIQWLL
jgi:hypothetical protein